MGPHTMGASTLASGPVGPGDGRIIEVHVLEPGDMFVVESVFQASGWPATADGVDCSRCLPLFLFVGHPSRKTAPFIIPYGGSTIAELSSFPVKNKVITTKNPLVLYAFNPDLDSPIHVFISLSGHLTRDPPWYLRLRHAWQVLLGKRLAER